MSEATQTYRGGDVELSSTKPKGQPFLKPLYGFPPYQYTGDVVLMIVYEADEAALREVLRASSNRCPATWWRCASFCART
jgi:hypothetical protein